VRRIYKGFQSDPGFIPYPEGRAMQAHKEQWQQLCEQIAIEQDPTRFTTLVDELNKLLEEKERRLDQLCEPNRMLSKAR
jgi:poly-beta-hydroxyalkanoate depolymerase